MWSICYIGSLFQLKIITITIVYHFVIFRRPDLRNQISIITLRGSNCKLSRSNQIYQVWSINDVTLILSAMTSGDVSCRTFDAFIFPPPKGVMSFISHKKKTFKTCSFVRLRYFWKSSSQTDSSEDHLEDRQYFLGRQSKAFPDLDMKLFRW